VAAGALVAGFDVVTGFAAGCAVAAAGAVVAGAAGVAVELVVVGVGSGSLIGAIAVVGSGIGRAGAAFTQASRPSAF